MRQIYRLSPVAAAFLTLALAAVAGQWRGVGGQEKIPSDLEIQQAAAAIEQADGYADIVAATTRYVEVLSSPRVVELVDGFSKIRRSTRRSGVCCCSNVNCRSTAARSVRRLLPGCSPFV